jgi:hypothetical protein
MWKHEPQRTDGYYYSRMKLYLLTFGIPSAAPMIINIQRNFVQFKYARSSVFCLDYRTTAIQHTAAADHQHRMSTVLRIAGISGSLRKDSWNTKLLKAFAVVAQDPEFTQKGIHFEIVDWSK